jgi:uncharacterized protein YbcV (DUF1398 family)/DNA-binding CsgD family transcriptional regulator
MNTRSSSQPLALQITPLDRQVLQRLANGDRADDVAAGLGMSPPEIRMQLRKLFSDLGATTQAEAIALAHRRDCSRRGCYVDMFTIEQINDLHTRLGSARTFSEYVRALKTLGVERYDSYLADGHSGYFGQGGHRVVSPPVHEVLSIAETSQRETFLEQLRRHEQGQTTHLEMSRGLAHSGIEKWTVDTRRMTMTFSDKAGVEMLVEQIR